ncbi:MAG: glycosyltransferase [Rhodospirillales bacterium]|nr:glycosyltransferase [Rhodospirillales bacterium]
MNANDESSGADCDASAGRCLLPSGRIRILHLITSLEFGGAEITLEKVCRLMDHDRYLQTVVSLTAATPLSAAIERAGVQVHYLNMKKNLMIVGAFWRLLKIVRRERPDIIQSWLYHADLLATIARRICSVKYLLWNVRCSNMDLTRYNKMTSAVRRCLPALSQAVDCAVVNSGAGERFHKGLGYRPRRWKRIENGFDCGRFKPDNGRGKMLRARWGIAEQVPVVGVVARNDPMKGYPVLLQAIDGVIAVMPDTKFVLIGNGVERLHHDAVVSLPPQEDIAACYTAFDVFCLPSLFGEGFSNVIGEAMACGVPVVATDVGDNAWLVGDTGWTVPPGDAASLARGLVQALSDLSVERKQAARNRIAGTFHLDHMISAYQDLYEDIVAL